VTLAIIPWLYSWTEPTVAATGRPAALSTRGAPYTGFGDVLFGILSEQNRVAEWASEGVRSTRHVSGSNRNVTQLLGIGPQTVTYRVYLESHADYRALLALRQTTATLTVAARITTATGEYEDIHGMGYLHLANVTLLDVTNPAFWLGREIVEADCLFLKDND
jgi:hypothetical protein